jgi:hypothetical protein
MPRGICGWQHFIPHGSLVAPLKLQRALVCRWRTGQRPALQQGHDGGDAFSDIASAGK